MSEQDEKFEKWWSGLASEGLNKRIEGWGCVAIVDKWRVKVGYDAAVAEHANEWRLTSEIICNGRALVEVYESRNPCLIVIKHADQVCVSDKWTHWRYHNPPPKPKKAWEKAWGTLQEISGVDTTRILPGGFCISMERFEQIFNMGRESK